MLKTLLALALIGSAATAQAEALNVHVRLPDGVQFPEYGSQPRLVLTLWGYDNLLADASASELRTIQKKLVTLDQRFVLSVEDDVANDIDQGAGEVHEVGFYVDANVDMNGDGKICEGDLRQDYDRSDTEYFSAFPSPMIELPMKVIGPKEGCR